MKLSPKISVIVPVYNAEKFLDRCLKSITSQSYENIEIIVIDDGSNDNSAQICDEFSLLEPRAKVLHEVNKGVSAARNLGLATAKGDYIYFADADDFLLPNCLSILVDKAIGKNSEIVIAGYQVASNRYATLITPTKTETNDDFIISLLNGKNHSGLWNKLFDKRLFEGIFFQENIRYLEDKVLMIKMAISKKPNISYINSPVYTYWQNSDSVTNNFDERLLDIYKAYLQIAENLLEEDVNSKILDIYKIKAFESILFVLNTINNDYLRSAIEESQSFLFELKKLQYKPKLLSKHRTINLLLKLPSNISIKAIKPINNIRRIYRNHRTNRNL